MVDGQPQAGAIQLKFKGCRTYVRALDDVDKQLDLGGNVTESVGF